MFHAAAWHMWYTYGLSYNKNTDVLQSILIESQKQKFSVKHDWTDIFSVFNYMTNYNCTAVHFGQQYHDKCLIRYNFSPCSLVKIGAFL